MTWLYYYIERLKGRFTLALFLFTFCSSHLHAQSVAITYSEFKNDLLIIHYDLSDSVAGQNYTVRLYASRDNFLNPLEKVAGATGLDVKPGSDNKIAWAYRDELPADFNGRISLEIRAKPFIPFISTESLNERKVYKRNRKYDITWSGGTPQNIINIDLMKGETKVYTFPNLANVGHHVIEFPGYIKKGTYQFKISDSKNKEEMVYTDDFKIRPKVPMLVKIVPVIAMGAAIYLLLPKKSGDLSIPDPITPH